MPPGGDDLSPLGCNGPRRHHRTDMDNLDTLMETIHPDRFDFCIDGRNEKEPLADPAS
jgi:hypothetical protein